MQTTIALLRVWLNIMFTLSKDKKVENPLGTTSPKKILQEIDGGKTDCVPVSEATYDPEFEQAMEAYKKVSCLYKNALRELAK